MTTTTTAANNLLAPENSSSFPCYINGELTETKSKFPVFDPHDRTRVIRAVYGVNVEEAATAVEAAAEALVGSSIVTSSLLEKLTLY